MPIGPEQQLINEQYVQLLGRFSLTTGTTTTSVPLNAGSGAVPPATPGPDKFFPVPMGQAIRIVHAAAQVQDASGTNQLTCWSLSIFIWGGNGFNIAFAPSPQSMVKLGFVWAYYESDELITYTDYAEQGGIPPNVHIGMQAAVANADGAAAHNVSTRLDMLVEYYLLRPSGHVGYP
jgi:hypothetical protein